MAKRRAKKRVNSSKVKAPIVEEEDLSNKTPDSYHLISSNNVNGIRSTTAGNVIRETRIKYSECNSDCLFVLDTKNICVTLGRKIAENSIVSLNILKKNASMDNIKHEVENILRNCGNKIVTFENLRVNGSSDSCVISTMIKLAHELDKLNNCSFIDEYKENEDFISEEMNKYTDLSSSRSRSQSVVSSPEQSSDNESLIRLPETIEQKYYRLMHAPPPKFTDEHRRLLLECIGYRSSNITRLDGYDTRSYNYLQALGLNNNVDELSYRLKRQLRKSLSYSFDKGQVVVHNSKDEVLHLPIPTLAEIRKQVERVQFLLNNSEIRSLATDYILEEEKDFDNYLKKACEEENKFRPHTPGHQTPIADAHEHWGGSLQPEIIRLVIVDQLSKNEIVFEDPVTKNTYTLKELFVRENLPVENLTVQDLCIDSYGIRDFATFEQRFTLFRNKLVHDVIFDREGLLSGKLIAYMWKLELESREKLNVCSEVRISLSGKNITEFAKWSSFFHRFRDTFEHRKFKVALQTPKISETLIGTNSITNFSDIVRNIFEPLFKALEDIDSIEYWFLTRFVSSFDLVSNEGKETLNELFYTTADRMVSRDLDVGFPTWCCHWYWNIAVLNLILTARGLARIEFSPHCLEVKSCTNNGLFAFLFCHSISHGRVLDNCATSTLLFLITQITMKMSLESNRRIYRVPIHKNPFGKYNNVGLSVVLTSDDAMILSREIPGIIQEQVHATSAFTLSFSSIAEIRRRSILASPWREDYYDDSAEKTAVPPIRELHRKKRYEKLIAMIHLDEADD